MSVTDPPAGRSTARAFGHARPRGPIRGLAAVLLMLPAPALAAAPPLTLPAGLRSFTIVDDGDRLDAEIVDGLPIDTYVYHPGAGPKAILVETDRARHLFRFPAGDTVDFAIRHQGRLYRQRLAPVEPHRWVGPDRLVLPFELGRNHTILVAARVNGSRPLKLLFDTGASVSVLAEEGAGKGAALAGPTGSIRLGAVEVRDTPIIAIPYGGTLHADGVLGYNLFLGRQVAIDYGRRELRIGPPAAAPPGFRTARLRWQGARTLVEVIIDDGTRQRTIPMLLDTGSKWSLSLGNSDALARNSAHLAPLGWRYARRADGQEVESRVLKLPRVTFAGYTLTRVQADVETPGTATLLPTHILGNDFLRRFDLVLDYRNGLLHARPNASLHAPYNRASRFSRAVLLAIGGFAIAGVALAALVWLRRRRRKILRTGQA
jgi:predicted aspartyl protease